ncbi:MAG: Cys-tRNA(Pro) deacylase [Gammaproteobacteria bacterium]|nr:MAG: Cys-tRNA(Pro) deacylase [Gammaproteobacteria bacterium]
MTPAVHLVKKRQIDFVLHEYHHDSGTLSYGLEAAEKLAVDPACVFKTLVVSDEKAKLAVAVLPVGNTLNLKKMAKALSVKKVAMADPKVVERNTGYVLGGVSPLGQKRLLPTVIDASAQCQKTIYVSAGRRGLEIELSAKVLAQVLGATFADIVSG